VKINYECGACFLRQAKEAMDLSTDDEDLKIELMNDIFNFLSSNFDKTTNSNKTGSTIHNMIKEKTGCEDPYFREKIEGNQIALKYLPVVKEVLKENNSLENYVKIAIIGNILDFGAFTLDTDIGSLIGDALEQDLAIKDIDDFENALKKYDKVLYLVDNTGEIVFDKLLLSKISEYDLDITIAVKSKPILNDACRQDAIDVGLDEFGKIVDIGAGTVGYVDSEISDDFREIFNSHKFIISKGMGNYEGLTEIDLSSKDIFFLLCSKCTTISKDIGVNLQDMLLLKNKN
jgi:damage-control phosphatase, subfamily I